MHPIEKVAAHEAVAAGAIDVHARTARHQQMRAITVGIKKALQQGLPLQVLVQFVKHRYGRLGAQPVKAQQFRQRSRPTQQLPAITGIIPVEIGVTDRFRNPRLAHLSRAADERHLAVLLEVFAKYCSIDSWPVHEDHYTEYRKIVQTILRRHTGWVNRFAKRCSARVRADCGVADG